jgi:predicted DNA-binding transcriptional regulator AlpA
MARRSKHVASFGELEARQIAKASRRVSSSGTQKGEERIDRLLTVEEAAEILRCSASSLNKWRGSGAGPRFVYIGNRIRYRTSDIIAYVNRQTRASTSASEAPAA